MTVIYELTITHDWEGFSNRHDIRTGDKYLVKRDTDGSLRSGQVLFGGFRFKDCVPVIESYRDALIMLDGKISRTINGVKLKLLPDKIMIRLRNSTVIYNKPA